MDLYQFLMITMLCIFTFILLAGALWFWAQLVRREKRLSILDLVLFLSSLGVALAGLVAIVLWNWETICAWLGGISPGTGSQLSLLIVAGSAALRKSVV